MFCLVVDISCFPFFKLEEENQINRFIINRSMRSIFAIYLFKEGKKTPYQRRWCHYFVISTYKNKHHICDMNSFFSCYTAYFCQCSVSFFPVFFMSEKTQKIISSKTERKKIRQETFIYDPTQFQYLSILNWFLLNFQFDCYVFVSKEPMFGVYLLTSNILDNLVSITFLFISIDVFKRVIPSPALNEYPF